MRQKFAPELKGGTNLITQTTWRARLRHYIKCSEKFTQAIPRVAGQADFLHEAIKKTKAQITVVTRSIEEQFGDLCQEAKCVRNQPRYCIYNRLGSIIEFSFVSILICR